MGVYSTKLNAKYNGTVKQVNIYTTAAEATPNYPVTGTYWECKVGGSVGYIALYPVANLSTSGHDTSLDAYLTVKKGGVEYRMQTAADRRFLVTINQSANQTITVSCGGSNYTSSFYATAGSSYTASISASSGYNAGALSSTSGTVNGAITISAGAATSAVKTATFTVPYASTSIGGGGRGFISYEYAQGTNYQDSNLSKAVTNNGITLYAAYYASSITTVVIDIIKYGGSIIVNGATLSYIGTGFKGYRYGNYGNAINAYADSGTLTITA